MIPAPLPPMRDDHKRIAVAGALTVLVFLSALWLFLAVDSCPGHRALRASLTALLTEISPGTEDSLEEPLSSETVVYVLGGSHKDLEQRFKTAAALCRQGPCGRIVLFSAPGAAEYEPALGRNLTNDEWQIKKLTGLGVPREVLDPVSFKKGIFGTFTEATGLSALAAQRGYKRILLVTSQFHTRRTWITFSKTFAKRNIAISIQAAHDSVTLGELLSEYLKYLIYKDILLPTYRG